ncbi:MAG: UPF0182 family protein [Gemmatimonadaceae bacterium]|nr:UPF0182 family protein [Gemmatimonadaceae bacterium]
MSDPSGRIAAPSIASASARLAFAWNQQNPRLLFTDAPGPAPVLVTVRDVRDRLARIAPTLQAGSQVVPLMHGDSLLWALDLYAVSATYPLSEHVMLNGEEYAAAQFAATALVNAHTGRVVLLQEKTPPLLARRPLERLAPHLVPMASLPTPCAVRCRRVPTPSNSKRPSRPDSGRVPSRMTRAALVRRGGPLVDFSVVRGAMADSALARDDYVPVWLPIRRTYALSAAAIDARGAVRGVVLAPGGEDRRTRWLPTPEGAPYDGVIRSAQETSDSLRQPGSLTGARRSSTRVVPGSGAPRFLTPYFGLRDGRPTQLTAVLLSDGLRRGVAPTVPEAVLSWRDGGRSVVPTTAAAAMYRQMRDALQRGAWSEFGASFEALGRALGVPRDSVPR